MRQVLVILDLDNTVYNFIDYFAPCFRGMVHALSRGLQVTEDALYEDFRRVFGTYGSIEYPFSVQELSFCKHLSKEEVANLVRVARGAFARVRTKHLEPYPFVQETLANLKEAGVLIVAVSNAPYFHALSRLKSLHLDKYFNGLICWKGYDLPDDSLSRTFIEKHASTREKSRIDKVWKLDKNELKPNIDGYMLAINYFRVALTDTYVVGDSIPKDVSPAENMGAIGIWAKYGEAVEEKNLKTVLRISNWKESKIQSIYVDRHAEPGRVIDKVSDLLDHVVPAQLKLLL